MSALYQINGDERAALLEEANSALVEHICECALNVLRENISLTVNHKKWLRKYVSVLRKLAEPSGTLKRKKSLLVQQGGSFLPALLAPLLSTLLTTLVER